MQFKIDPGCIMCQLQHDKDIAAEPYNEVIYSGKYHFIIAGLGGFIEGYAMIVTKDHICNFANLPDDHREEFELLRNKVEKIFKNKYKKVLIFEHGNIEGERINGGCIDHAHLHFMATDADLLSTLKSSLDNSNFETSVSFPTINKEVSYLYVKQQDTGGVFIHPIHEMPRQYARKLIAKLTNFENYWDYRIHLYEENSLHTINDLKDYF